MNAAMYVQGMSSRKVDAITEQLCGTRVSAAQVSRAAEKLETWWNRPLGEATYLYVNARYEKVQQTAQSSAFCRSITISFATI
ncbi:MAG: transposase [Anaerolineaceae bacterium]|nr:transposase [Anaerolineaceae bacterium]